MAGDPVLDLETVHETIHHLEPEDRVPRSVELRLFLCAVG